MSTQQDFDRLLKDRLANMSTSPTEEKWALLEKRIKANTPEILPAPALAPTSLAWYTTRVAKGIAAGLILVLGITSTFLFNKSQQTTSPIAKQTNTEPTTTTSESVNNTTNSAAPIANSLPAQNNVGTTSVTPNSNATSIIQPNPSTTHQYLQKQFTPAVAQQQNNILDPKIEIPINNITNNNSTVAANQSIVENNNSTIINNPVTPANATAVVTSNANNLTPSTNSNHNTKKTPIPFILQEKPRYATVWPKSNINIIATSALGSLGVKTSAYNIGVNTEQKINNRIYIDATVAYAANNPTSIQNALYANANADVAAVNSTKTTSSFSPTLDVYGVNTVDNSFRAGGNNIPVEELSDVAGIAEAAAYRLATTQLEAAPLVGFRITPRIAVLAGADASHILTTSKYKDGINHLNLINNRTPIAMNNWDAGLVSKVELQVSKRFVVGVRYRGGLTNVVSNSTINTKRNYTGIVLKTRIR
jgi:hypothetical protein